MSNELPQLLITLGAILLGAPALRALAQRVHVPHVSLLLLAGVVVGPMGLDLLPEARQQWYPALAEIALAMVGFLLGGEFTWGNLKQRGRSVLVVSAMVSAVTFVGVAAGLMLLGCSWPAALLLATAATATDPAAVDAVARESGASGPTTSLLRGVVAVDDVWGMLLFGGVLGLLQAYAPGGGEGHALGHAVAELGGSLALGGVLGLVMAAVTGRITPGEPTRLEGLGFVLLCCGLASALGLSYLLSAVVMGTVVANLARHHETSFRELEAVEAPFLTIFFVLSGATASFGGGGSGIAWWVAGYVVLRTLSRAVGGALGVRASAPGLPLHLGLALLPQAGVALGMTLVAVERIPSLAETALPVVVISTVCFETVGPLVTRWVLARAGELSPTEGS